MGGELSHADIKETEPKLTESYKDIKPEKELSTKELNNAVYDEMNKAANEIKSSLPDENKEIDKNSTLTHNHRPDSCHNTVNDGKDAHSDAPIYLITRNESLENDRHPITGVWFEKRVVDLPNGERIEGVFPRFDSLFDAKIPEEMYIKNYKVQFCECNKQLALEIDRNPELKEKFSEEQLEQIRDGIHDGSAPDGYVWHHDAECGCLQLVDSEIHSITGHTGGHSIWGGGSDNR